uniref:Interleukin family protein n=1 Tax=Neogobius melanostomus TaxID=47308 RepID=A0A8C6T0M6_9GOBI
MLPRPLLVVSSLLAAFALLAREGQGSPTCNNKCCRFIEGFPVRLRKLRENYLQIRDYYEANDDLDTALLDDSVDHSFKSPFACQAMDAILGFYLRTVLPRALEGVTEDTKSLRPHMESIQLIFDELKRQVAQCRNYFSCKKQFDIRTLNSTYTQMQDKGLFKAMGELDILFNYIERYLASKRQKTASSSA